MKIAILGSAPSSVALAPFNDPLWEIWGCSPGLFKFANMHKLRISRWFEIHHFIPPENEFTPEYIAWMASLGPDVPVYMIEQQPSIPNSVPYPKTEMLNNFGPYFFTSSISWMFALALSIRGVQEIGLWGVDMSHATEWEHQRPACHHFITKARERGIKIATPPQSDLLWPPPLYGFHEADPRWVKLNARQKELQARYDEAAAAHAESDRGMFFFKGALDDMTYHMRNYATVETHGCPSGPFGGQSSRVKSVHVPAGDVQGAEDMGAV